MKTILYCALSGLSVLYLAGELAAQTFQDVSIAAGFFGENSSWAGAWADYDNDGDLDVITLGHVQNLTGSITQLWRNNGDATFSDVTVQVGMIPTNGDVHGAAWADFDGDGHVDLLIAKEVPRDVGPELWRNNGNGTFTNVAAQVGFTLMRHGRGIYGVDYDRDGDLDFFILDWRDPELATGGGGNLLYRNEAGQQFAEVAAEAGIARKGQPNRTAAWADFNGDGFTDVLVLAPQALDGLSCGLFTNRGDGTFRDVTATAGIRMVSTCANGAWGDYDNDADLDLYITMSADISGILYRNNGNGTFTDITVASGIRNATNARGVVWGDYDNDGDLDLYIVNINNATTPNRLFRNNGDGTFTDVTAEAGVEAQVSGGGADASFADYNNDGFLDLFVTNGVGSLKGPYVLLENGSKTLGNQHHWLKVQLEGRQSNRDGLMTKLWVTTRQGSQFREYSGPAHYMSQDHAPLHVGLGTATVIKSIELMWPSGVRQIVENLAADQVVPIVEGQSLARGQPAFSDVGYYVWQTSTGEWHLRWYGSSDEPRHQFTGRITTDGVLSGVASTSLEETDTLTWDASTIELVAFARGSFDGVRFTTTGTQVTFTLQQNGAARPRAVHIGKYGLRPGTLPLTLKQSGIP